MPTSIAQTWVRIALEGMTFEAAVDAPRLHIEPFADGIRAQFEPGIDASALGNEFVLRPFAAPDMYFGAVKLAALDGRGLDVLADSILERLAEGSIELEYLIPYDKGDRLDELYRLGEVVKQSHDAAGTRVVARVPIDEQYRFADHLFLE